MTASGDCLDCGRHVVFSSRQRCNACYQAARKRLALKPCGRCGRSGRIWPELGHCGQCAFGDWRRSGPDRIRECVGCGTVARITGRDLCSACFQKDPAWPFRYAERLTCRLDETPRWFGDYADYLAERYSPAQAVHHLRWIGTAITTAHSTRPEVVAAALPVRSKTFDDFVADTGLGFVHDPEPARAKQRRRERLDEIPTGYAEAAEGFCDAMLRRQDRARRLGVRADANRTIEARLRTIRDFAVFTHEHTVRVDRVELVTVAEVEAFLTSRHPRDAATQLAYLRQFFTWCRRHKLVLADPTAGLWRDSKPVFAGSVLSLETQRQLCARWTNPSDDMNPYEPAVGLLAMLHALSRRDLINLKAQEVAHSSIEVVGRPEPVPLDPATSDAVARVIEHRDRFGTANPHLIINEANARNRRPVNGGYLTSIMVNGPAITLRALRATRLSALVGDLDPITVSTAIGIDTTAAIYYLSEPEPHTDDGSGFKADTGRLRVVTAPQGSGCDA